MDRLPFELQHLIFALVDRSDVRNLRLACKTLAHVGLDYLLPEVEITFTRKSFDHLAEIVRHPILSHRLKSLVYHIDVLREHHDKDEWMQAIGDRLLFGINTFNSWMPPRPASDAPKRDWRLYRRNRAKAFSPEWIYTEKQLAVGYATYKRVWSEQHHLRQQDFGSAEIMAMVSQLPNLKHITLSNFLDAIPKDNNTVGDTLEGTLLEAFGDENYEHHCGVPQLLSLFHGIHLATADIKLESLNMGMISWKILQERDHNLAIMKEILRPLKLLKMGLSTSQNYGWHALGDFDDEAALDGNTDCQAFLNEGRLPAMIKPIPNLQVLDLTFHSTDWCKFDLISTFGDCYWPCLREIHLHLYYSDDKNLLDVLGRHAETLKVVHMQHYRLLRGLWPEVFCSLRTNFHLEEFFCWGLLTNSSTVSDHWDFCGGSDRQKSIRESIAAYVRGDDSTTFEDVLKIANA
ncbi:MAG: hypothetical protein Q9178_003763 [Gyalolechia marmorata]